MKPGFLFALALALTSSAVLAQSGPAKNAGDYPSRPLRFITGFLPGGVSDVIARTVAEKLGERLGQRIVVDGRPGAGGVLSMEIAANANPDGHTLYLGQPVITISRLFKNKPAFDPILAFAPVTLLGTGPTMMTVHPSTPANSVRELIAYAKTRPGGLNFGSSGAGTTNHFSGELFRVMAGIPLIHIPYKGAALNSLAAIQGEIQIAFLPLAAAIPQVKAGKLKALAVTGAKRATAVPDVPTIAETLPGYRVEAWYGMLVPAKTPRAVIARLNRETNAILATQEVKTVLLNRGIEVEGSTPEALARLIREDAVRWEKLVKEGGLKLE
ncbi:MAG: tripartite tricarboxylate transporter substrate binding protein [Pseudomonadota bacterium]